MTASEFVFLALGLGLGVASGAALLEFLRARPPAPREVKVTMASDAVPRRAATLSDATFSASPSEPAHGGPADRRHHDEPVSDDAGRRTPVRTGVMSPQGTATPVAGGTAIALPVTGGRDPMLDAIAARSTDGDASERAAGSAHADVPSVAATDARMSTPVALAEAPPAARGQGETPGGPAGAEAAATPGDPAGRCAELRRISDERCEVATQAKARAEGAREAMRTAQRTYDDHVSRAEAAARSADARTVRADKDAAQATFRAVRAGATTSEEVDRAARDWLLEINRINSQTREATATAQRERDAAAAMAATLERLSVEADAARIAGETAEAACLAARQAAAECDEKAAVEEDAARIAAARDGPWPDGEDGLPASREAAGTPLLFRILRGDRAAMLGMVEQLAGDDPAERRQWQLAVSDLVDAILATAIEASSLEFPEDHPFWQPFTLVQRREIAEALASLGYRFDGLGGWLDARVPSQRDLSLAVGYAGLDPMRIRHWPTESDMVELLRDVTVAADEYVAGAAPELSLGELVAMLGRRADDLADVWNAWGRIRPLLLTES